MGNKQIGITRCVKCGEIVSRANLGYGQCTYCGAMYTPNGEYIGLDAEDMETVRPTHTEVCSELREIYYDKNNRYGNSFADTINKYGMTTVAIRLHDKLKRLEYLVKQDQSEERDDAIKDALLDTANYAIMGIMEL